MDIEPNLIAEPDANEADSLVSSNDPDDMENEQTWPTEEEMNSGHEDAKNTIPDAPKGTTPRFVRVPKGTSSYQAAWYVDETDDEEEGRGDGDCEMREEEEEEEEMVDLVIDEDKSMDVESRHVHFEELDDGEEERQCVSGKVYVPSF